MKQKFIISGMSCAACAARVEKAARSVRGVLHAEVNLLAGSLQVEGKGEQVDTSAIIAAVQQAGYGAELSTKEQGLEAASQVQKEAQHLRRRFCSSVAFLLPLMCLSMGPMVGVHIPGVSLLESGCIQGVLAGIIVWINREIFISGFKSLYRGGPNMNSLIALGSSAAMVYSCVELLALAGSIAQPHGFYFESAAMILTLITLGKYLESRAKQKTSNAIGRLLRLAPKQAWKVQQGQLVSVNIEQVRVGDILAVKAGQAVAADGVIQKGYGAIDESALTGESIPVDKTIGQSVRAGTVNLDGYFEFKVTQTGQNTLLSQIVKLVEEASSSKAPIGRLADRISGIFVPVVLLLALLTALVWIICGAGIEFALSAAVAVLVISCPCALGLATPTAIMVGTGEGARHGILFKSAQALERTHEVQVVVLDKTGTLTQGQPEVTDQWFSPQTDQTDFWRWVVSAETPSSHPLSRAILRAEKAQKVVASPVDEFKTFPGAGIQASVGESVISIGNAALMRKIGVALENACLLQTKTWAQQGKTVLFVAKDKTLLGALALADCLKPGTSGAIRALKQMGLEIWLLSGDAQASAQAIAAQAGIAHVKAEVLPQDKEAQVRYLQESGKTVAMVGDGINDAPALTRADIGIAVGAGTEVALESADIVLVKNDLADVLRAMKLSRAVIINIKENLFWAFFYNVLGIPLAAGVFYPWLGWQLNPMIAALAMSLSSVFVVGNALRLRNLNLQKIGNEESVMEKKIEIEGMMCEHCAGRVQAALAALPGENARVDLAHKCAYVSGPASDEEIKEAVEKAGYQVRAIK